MTWYSWQVSPFITSIFFVLGVVTLYQVLFDGIRTAVQMHNLRIDTDKMHSWFGVFYMLIFVYSMQVTVSGKATSWEFMNFQLMALIFCSYFLNIKIPYRWFVPIILLYMIINSSIGYWESWCHAATIMSFYSSLNYIRRHERAKHPFIHYILAGIIYGALLWFFIKLKFNLSWLIYSEGLIYLIIFEVLLYSYITMLLRDSDLKIHLVEFANHDALTQTENYAAFNSAIKYLFKNSSERHTDLTMMMFDIDHFKKVNDTYGHLAGDKVLRHVVDVVQTVIDNNDKSIKLYRTGGEEFNVVFPEYQLLETETVVREIFEALNHLEVDVGDQSILISISIGVAQKDSKDNTPADFYRRVDQELYHSKKNGRMQISVQE